MRPKKKIIAAFIVILVLFCITWYNNGRNVQNSTRIDNITLMSTSKQSNRIQEMAIAVVVCGNRTEETLVMLKSALLLTKEHLHFYIFAEDLAANRLKERLEQWQETVNRTYSFEIRQVEFPPGEYQTDWKKLFKPCASQRLFLPTLLRETDSILYVDTDTLFLSPVEQVWNHFALMNQTQMAALAPEHEDPNIGWYNRFAKHPFYKPLGVNTGVMLMNLTRMRAFGWENYITPIYKQYKTKIPWGDQDIINILFSFHPDKLYIYGCNYNYRADHCMYTNVCKTAEKEGVIVLHGSRGIFHNDKHATFRRVYQTMEDYNWADDPYHGFMIPLKKNLNYTSASHCDVIRPALLKNLEKFIENPPVRR